MCKTWGGLAISLNYVMSNGNYTASQIFNSLSDTVDKKHFLCMHAFSSSPQIHTFPLLPAKCKCFPGIKVYKCH